MKLTKLCSLILLLACLPCAAEVHGNGSGDKGITTTTIASPSNFTLSFWIRPDTNVSGSSDSVALAFGVGNGSSGVVNEGFYYNNSGGGTQTNACYYKDSGGTYHFAQATGVGGAGVLYMVICTYDGSNLISYVACRKLPLRPQLVRPRILQGSASSQI